MVIHSPFTAWDHRNYINYELSWNEIVDGTHASLDEVVRRAESQGVEMVMENILDVNPDDRRALVESFDSKALRVSLDTGHAHISRQMNGADPVDHFVHSAGEMLAHVHLQDTDGFSDRHWAIGEGTILWPAVFRALAKIDSTPRLILELRDKAGIRPSVDYLKGHGLGA